MSRKAAAIYSALILSSIFILFAYSSVPERGDTAAPTSHELEPVRTLTGITGRTLVPLREGYSIVLQYPVQPWDATLPNGITISESDATDDSWKSDEDVEDRLRLYEEPPDSKWFVSSSSLSELTTFNCATYAIGDVIALSKWDWLETKAVGATNYTQPAADVLANYFNLVATYSANEINELSLEESDKIRLGDVISFYRSSNESEHIHLAKIQKVGDRHLLISKLGGGQIVCGSVKATAKVYEREFTEIRIYRLQPQ